MNTLEIYCKLLSLKCKVPTNFDVLAKDQLNGYNIAKPYGLCVNISNSNHNGTHWVVIYQSKNSDKILFLDPLGMPCTHYGDEFLKFIKFQKGQLLEFPYQFQSIISDCCGEFCITFLYLLANNVRLNDLKSYFLKNLTDNDRIVKRFVISISSKCLPMDSLRGSCLQICESYKKRRS